MARAHELYQRMLSETIKTPNNGGILGEMATSVLDNALTRDLYLSLIPKPDTMLSMPRICDKH